MGSEPSPNFDRAELELYLMILGKNQAHIEHIEVEFFQAWQFCDRAELELLKLLSSLYKNEP